MRKVLEGRYVLTRKDQSTHYKIPFTVSEDAEKMFISVAYEPKYNYDEEYGLALIKESMMKQAGEPLMTEGEMRACLPLDNHLSFSLDSPEGAVGTAHRGNNKQNFTICAESAEGGFYPCKIVKGNWIFTVSVTCIITDEITVSLKIEVGQ